MAVVSDTVTTYSTPVLVPASVRYALSVVTLIVLVVAAKLVYPTSFENLYFQAYAGAIYPLTLAVKLMLAGTGALVFLGTIKDDTTPEVTFATAPVTRLLALNSNSFLSFFNTAIILVPLRLFYLLTSLEMRKLPSLLLQRLNQICWLQQLLQYLLLR